MGDDCARCNKCDKDMNFDDRTDEWWCECGLIIPDSGDHPDRDEEPSDE